MYQFKFRFALLFVAVFALSACGGGTSETASNDANNSDTPTTVQPDQPATPHPDKPAPSEVEPPAPTKNNAVVMVSSNADLSNAHPLEGTAAEGNVYIYFQEGSDWPTRGVKRVDFYCCKNSSSSHTQFPSDTTSPYGINIDLSQYQDGNYELYIDVFFNDQISPVPFYVNFDINNSSLPKDHPNNAPSIIGNPDTSVYNDNTYSFTPTANDIDGDALTFSIVNKPAWAIFNPSTGQLTGTPSSADVGTYSNIIISVTDSFDTTSLAPFNISVVMEPAPPTNNPPTITGSPAGTVYEDDAYSFTPTANDIDGDALTFSIVNKPFWATFNTSTGHLTGTPSNADIGTYPNITVSVTDGIETTSLASFSIGVIAQPIPSIGSATLTWTPPTTYTDGTPLAKLAGYKIYYGTSPGSYPHVIDLSNPGLTTYVVEGLTGKATYYFVITAYDLDGVESAFSNSGDIYIP